MECALNYGILKYNVIRGTINWNISTIIYDVSGTTGFRSFDKGHYKEEFLIVLNPFSVDSEKDENDLKRMCVDENLRFLIKKWSKTNPYGETKLKPPTFESSDWKSDAYHLHNRISTQTSIVQRYFCYFI